jgi:hypothetical protein
MASTGKLERTKEMKNPFTGSKKRDANGANIRSTDRDHTGGKFTPKKK